MPKPPVGRTTAMRPSRTAFGCSVFPSAATAWYPTANKILEPYVSGIYLSKTITVNAAVNFSSIPKSFDLFSWVAGRQVDRDTTDAFCLKRDERPLPDR